MNMEEEMLKLQQNDNLALEKIYLEMKNSVFALCFSILKNYSSAQDVMQDTFMNVKKYALKYKPNTNAKAWILTIAKNSCYNVLKKQKREVVTDFSLDIKDDKPLKLHDETGIIAKTTQILIGSELQIVLLHTLAGVPLKDLSKQLGLPEGTVRWKYHNALKKLQNKLQKEEATHEK